MKNAEKIRNQYPVGTRIELVAMDDPQAPMPGTRGPVKGVDSAGDLLMRWDTGSGLKLIVDVDKFMRVCPKCNKAYSDHPAMSRIDGTDICPECGVREALDAFFGARKK